jgi:hypothetical protein
MNYVFRRPYFLSFSLSFSHTGVWTQRCSLVRKVFQHLTYASSPLTLVILGTGSHFLPRSAYTVVFLFMPLAIAGMTGTCQQTQLFTSRWGLLNFFAQAILELYLPISASCVAGMSEPSSWVRWDLANFLPGLGSYSVPPHLSILHS